MRARDAIQTWAVEEFGRTDLGDVRRDRRVIGIGAAVARAPAGKISEVFESEAARQAAYDFVESPHIDVEAIGRGVGKACAARSAKAGFAFVAVDMTTLSMVDNFGKKGFGHVGPRSAKSAGIKVITALAVDPCGLPLGLAAQRYWAPPTYAKASRRQQKAESRKRLPQEKQTRYWLETIEETLRRFEETGAHPWFVIDREGDAQAVLGMLASSNARFTIRSSFDRVIGRHGAESKLHAQLQRAPVLGHLEIDVAAAPKRTARRARMQVRTAEVTLRMRIGDTRYEQLLRLAAVSIREVGTTPNGEAPLDWTLLTNHGVAALEDARLVVFSYTSRWRIEEMHKAWKSGACGIEDTQLRSYDAVVRWAIVLAAVAVRSERLKLLSREQPHAPASIELSPFEIRALILLKRRTKKRTETVPDAVPSLEQAVRWIADLGGYTGKSSGGPPGAITIGRGLAKVRAAAEALEQLEDDTD